MLKQGDDCTLHVPLHCARALEAPERARPLILEELVTRFVVGNVPVVMVR